MRILILYLLTTPMIFPATYAGAGPQQQPPPAPKPRSDADVIKSRQNDVTLESNLVILSVEVTDRAGHPVRKLSKDLFSVTEDGAAQQISTFDIEEIAAPGAAPAVPADAGALPHKAPVIDLSKIPSVEAAKEIIRDHRLIILFFDLTSLQLPDLERSQEAALKFVREKMTDADLVSVVSFASTLKMIGAFTNDPEAVKHAVESLKPGEGSGLAGQASTGDTSTDTVTGEDTSGSDPTNAFTPDETEFNIFNSDRKLAAIESIARQFRDIPQKKSLIHFSSGLSLTGVENQTQLQSATDAASQANMAIYTVDARGLVALPPGGDASQGAQRGTGLYSGQAYSRQFSALSSSQETLTTLAEDTGGRAFLDSNDLLPVFQRVQEDTRHYYVLGYYSTNNKKDGKYRQVRVTVSSPGARVKYRQGYFATKSFNSLSKSDREAQLQEAMVSERPFSELPFVLEANYFRVDEKRLFLPVSLKLPGSDVPFFKKGEKERAEFEFIGEIRGGQKNEPVSSVRDTIRIDLSEQTYQQVANSTIQYQAGFYLNPGNYRMRFLVRENQTGKIGTFEQSIVLPDYSKEKVKTSTIVLSGLLEAAKPESAAPLPAGPFDGLRRPGAEPARNPYLLGDKQIVPSVTRVFFAQQQLYIFFQVYDPGSNSATHQPDLGVTLLFFKDGKKYTETPTYRVDRYQGAGDEKYVNCYFTVPLAKFQRGVYTLQANVIDHASEAYTFRRINFAVR